MSATDEQLQGTVFVDQLVETARDLIEEPDSNPEYTRGILELLHDVTGVTTDKLREFMFPKADPFTQYAEEVVGGPLDTISDWQQVARELYEEYIVKTGEAPTP